MLFILLGRKVKCSEYLGVKIIFQLSSCNYDKINILIVMLIKIMAL